MKKQTVTLSLFIILITTLIVPGTILHAQEDRSTVFRDLTFGDSRTQARLTVLRDDFFQTPMVRLGKEALSPEGQADLRINNLNLDMVFFFNKKGLYRLDASGTSVTREQFDSTLQDHLDVLEKVMTKRFGAPSYTQRQDPDDVGSGEFKTVVYWSSEDMDGDREIWVGISGTENGYEPTLIIQDPQRADGDPLNDDTPSPKSLSINNASKLF